jgi:hypothetical protein
MLRRHSLVAAIMTVLLTSVASPSQAQHENAGGSAGSLTAADYAEIQQLYARYNTAIDSGDENTWASTFTPDGVFNNNVTGHDALVKFVRDWRERGNPTHLRHWNTNLLIQRTSEGAKGSVYLSLMDVGVKPPVSTITGMYEDLLVKTPQGWRFKRRTVHPDPPAAPPKP